MRALLLIEREKQETVGGNQGEAKATEINLIFNWIGCAPGWGHAENCGV